MSTRQNLNSRRKKISLLARGNLEWYIMLAPTIIVLLVITIYPLVYSLIISFQSLHLQKPNLPIRFIGLSNFISVVRYDAFLKSVTNTLLLALSSVSIGCLIGLGVALLLYRIGAGNIVLVLLVIPMTVTPVVSALVWRFMYHPQLGIINYTLRMIGISGITWLAKPLSAFISIVLVDVWQWTPFIIFILLAGLVSLPSEPFESVQLDGASSFQIFRYLTLPMLKKHIGVAILFRAIGVMKLFDTIYVLTQGGPGRATQTLSIYTYKLGFQYFALGEAAALSYLTLILLIVVALIIIRQFKLFW